MSILYVVGIGPGGLDHITPAAQEAIAASQVIAGYDTYLDLIRPLLTGKEIVSSGMTREVERCIEALKVAASGKKTALVSSGDAGIYGMAGLALELAESGGYDVEVKVIPGVSAVQAAASVLGAPLMHDFTVISLSDLLTPWELIRRRLQAAASADFVVALYNPKSRGRTTQIEEARRILLTSRLASTPVGIVRNACREGEERIVTTLGEMLDQLIDMLSIVVIGNSATRIDAKGRMVTPRGYERKMQCSQSSFDSAPSASPNGSGRAVMFCGTGSDVGKSVLAAGFCRILKKRGLSVAPFKSQNMALNSFATPDGGEIGRAQAVQAQACGIACSVDMNPVLLKPNSDTGSQVIVHGRPVGNMNVREYAAFKPQAFEKVKESYGRLSSSFDFIVIEGAGSIAEINLRKGDIANLKVAAMAEAPVLLVADIDRGGVFAQIVGTMELLEPEEREMIAGVLINKFRGDPSLLASGIEEVERRTGVPVLGVIPWFSGFSIPGEDSVALQNKSRALRRAACDKLLTVGVVRFPRISNFTDFEVLESEPDVELRYLEGGDSLDGLDLLILPGSKSTIADLGFLKETGLFDEIRSFGGPVVGICGGYQMLGKRVLDPCGVESNVAEAQGLSLLNAETTLLPHKETHQVAAELLPAALMTAPGCEGEVAGYEIHMGKTVLGEGALPFVRITRRSLREADVEDGAVSLDGRIVGTYLHGLFDNDGFRSAFLNRLRREKGMPERAAQKRDDPLDLLAAHLEAHLDLSRIFSICGIPR